MSWSEVLGSQYLAPSHFVEVYRVCGISMATGKPGSAKTKPSTRCWAPVT